MVKGPMDKIRAERVHAKRRARERLQITLNRKKLSALAQMIRNGDSKVRFFDKQSVRVTRWLVTINGQAVIAVYDNARGQIVTFLRIEETLPLAAGGPTSRNVYEAFREGERAQRDADQILVDFILDGEDNENINSSSL
jgi:hypothetical protein